MCMICHSVFEITQNSIKRIQKYGEFPQFKELCGNLRNYTELHGITRNYESIRIPLYKNSASGLLSRISFNYILKIDIKRD